MKKKKKKSESLKRLFLAAGVVIVCTSLFAMLYQKTYASLTDHDKEQNEFRIGDLHTTVEEEFDPPATFEPDKEYTKKVWVKNTGDLDQFIRVLALPILNKKQANGSTLVLPATTTGTNPVLTIDYNLVDWIEGEDGYYYYKNKIKPGEKTAPLFSKVTLNKANITEEYEGIQLSFEIKAEGVGITRYAYRDAWWGGTIPTTANLLKVDNVLKVQTIED